MNTSTMPTWASESIMVGRLDHLLDASKLFI